VHGPLPRCRASLRHPDGSRCRIVGRWIAPADRPERARKYRRRARDVSHDFDADSKSGVLWRHESGQVQFWEMDGLGIKTEGGVAHAPVPNDWHIQGAGDFDGDGNNDVGAMTMARSISGR
jgi:hypothetical protein